MDIYLDDNSRTFSAPHDFIISFDVPENITAFSMADSCYLGIQVRIRLQEKSVLSNRRPSLLTLSGTLNDGSIGEVGGGELVTTTSLPYNFIEPNLENWSNLTFRFSKGYIEYLEEKRAAGGKKKDLTLYLSLEGLLLVRVLATSEIEGSTPQVDNPLINSKQYFSNVVTEKTNRPAIRIARSDWQDRFLIGFGYKTATTLYVPELMLDGTSSELSAAIEHFQAARQLFLHEEYRAAVNRCRQVRDALLGMDKTTWSKTYLEPMVGEAKAELINQSIKSLAQLDHKSSHGDNDIEIDRDSARFVLLSLANILDYVARKSK